MLNFDHPQAPFTKSLHLLQNKLISINLFHSFFGQCFCAVCRVILLPIYGLKSWITTTISIKFMGAALLGYSDAYIFILPVYCEVAGMSDEFFHVL